MMGIFKFCDSILNFVSYYVLKSSSCSKLERCKLSLFDPSLNHELVSFSMTR